MNKYLVDTNIIIYYLNGEATAIDWLQSHQKQLTISVITKIEVLSYPFEEEEDILVQKFLNQFELIHLTDEIINATIKLRRQKKNQDSRCYYCCNGFYQGTVYLHKKYS